MRTFVIVVGVVVVVVFVIGVWIELRWQRQQQHDQSIPITKTRHAEMLDQESREER